MDEMEEEIEYGDRNYKFRIVFIYFWLKVK